MLFTGTFEQAPVSINVHSLAALFFQLAVNNKFTILTEEGPISPNWKDICTLLEIPDKPQEDPKYPEGITLMLRKVQSDAVTPNQITYESSKRKKEEVRANIDLTQ